jgi:hypothetical protein
MDALVGYVVTITGSTHDMADIAERPRTSSARYRRQEPVTLNQRGPGPVLKNQPIQYRAAGGGIVPLWGRRPNDGPRASA